MMGAIIKRGTRQAPRFYAQYTDRSKVRRTKLLRGAVTTEAARVMLAEIERNVMHGKLGIEEPSDDELARRTLTVRQLGDKFVAEAGGYSNPKVKDMKEYRRVAKWKLQSRIYPRIGERAVASLTVADLERFRDELLSEKGGKLKPASVTRTLAVLSKMFAWGRKQGLVDGESPTRGCVRPPATSSIDYLNRDEVAQLLEQAEESAPDVYPMIAAAIYTGLRKGELFGLRWIDVHLDAGRIDVMRSYGTTPKSGRARHLPIHPELARILRAWRDRCPAAKEGLVFPVDEGRGVRMGNDCDMLGIVELLEAAKCHTPDHPWHALRHTFASHFMMAGGNILTLQKLLGHATLAMTMVYAHLSPDHLAAEVARMSFAQDLAGTASMDEERRRRAQESPSR